MGELLVQALVPLREYSSTKKLMEGHSRKKIIEQTPPTTENYMDTHTEEHVATRLRQVRSEIDAVDQEILRMLNVRAKLSLEVGRIKRNTAETTGATFTSAAIFKPEREQQVLDNLAKHNSGPLPQEHVNIIWREIFSSSRALQRPQHVAYLGPEGTFSYFAGLEYLGKSVQMQPFSHFHEVFRAVYDGTCALGVVPLENSLEGTVGQCFDLFYNFDVFIQAELFLHINHNLLSLASTLAEVKKIYSHPQALAQCDAWLRAHTPGAELVPMQSTAAAARQAAAEKHSAAIGNAALAEMYPFHVLASSIESSADNWTRFVIISKKDTETAGPLPSKEKQSLEQQVQKQQHSNSLCQQTQEKEPQQGQQLTAQGQTQSQQKNMKTGGQKTSLLFTLIDKPGSLSAVLSTFAKHNINMRKLESRPLRLSGGECWRYVFFADVECNVLEEQYAPVLKVLREMCSSFRVLGAYPAALQHN